MSCSSSTGVVISLRPGQTLEQLADPDVDVHEAAVVSIERARLLRAVRALPMVERKVLAGRYGLGCDAMTCRELGRTLGISASGVVAIEQRALARLRGIYAEADAA